jgi:hypothetical protein
MNKNAGLLALIAIVIVVVAASGCSTNAKQAVKTPVGDKSTKLALTNNDPNAWLHVDLQLVNVTLKNGKMETLYLETFMKPGGTLTIDLSKLLGYGNNKLPAGTTIRILSWKGLYNPTAGGTSNLDLTMQGWSNTKQPGTGDQKLNIQFSQPLPIAKLPRLVKGNQYWVSNNPQKVNFLDNDANEPVFEEEMLTVDPNGKVIITLTTPPELCSAIAHTV